MSCSIILQYHFWLEWGLSVYSGIKGALFIFSVISFSAQQQWQGGSGHLLEPLQDPDRCWDTARHHLELQRLWGELGQPGGLVSQGRMCQHSQQISRGPAAGRGRWHGSRVPLPPARLQTRVRPTRVPGPQLRGVTCHLPGGWHEVGHHRRQGLCHYAVGGGLSKQNTDIRLIGLCNKKRKLACFNKVLKVCLLHVSMSVLLVS